MQDAEFGPQLTPPEKGLTPTFLPSLASSAHATAPHRIDKPCLTTGPRQVLINIHPSVHPLHFSLPPLLTKVRPELARHLELVSLHTTPPSFLFLRLTTY